MGINKKSTPKFHTKIIIKRRSGINPIPPTVIIIIIIKRRSGINPIPPTVIDRD